MKGYSAPKNKSIIHWASSCIIDLSFFGLNCYKIIQNIQKQKKHCSWGTMFFCLRNLYKGVSDRKIVIGFLLCCILYFLINALYLVKYGARYTSYYPIIVLIYAIFLIGFIFFKHKNKPSLKQVVILLAVNAIAIIILQMHIDTR